MYLANIWQYRNTCMLVLSLGWIKKIDIWRKYSMYIEEFISVETAILILTHFHMQYAYTFLCLGCPYRQIIPSKTKTIKNESIALSALRITLAHEFFRKLLLNVAWYDSKIGWLHSIFFVAGAKKYQFLFLLCSGPLRL